MKNNFSLIGKVALITGATGFLGKKMALGLAQAGAKVYINGKSYDKIAKIVTELNAAGYDSHPAAFDIVNEVAIKSFFANFSENTLDILVNNAYAGRSGTIETANAEEYRESYEISIVSTHLLTQSALPFLRNAKKINGDASIINIASMYGMVSPDISIYASKEVSNPPFYGAAKAALIQWTKYAACEFAKEGIRVNAISPGPFPSSEIQKKNPLLVQKIQTKVPLERIGLPEELMGPLIFLASKSASYVTGINLPVDGGWTAW